MKYFITNRERKGTCYYEFYKGKWDGKTFWKENSLFLHDDVLHENKGFAEALMSVIPNFAPYGKTEISSEDWKNIGKLIFKKDSNCQELYKEANSWVEDVFKTCDCFTILGI